LEAVNSIWGEVLRIGLPAGGELVVLAIYLMIVYSLIRASALRHRPVLGLALA